MPRSQRGGAGRRRRCSSFQEIDARQLRRYVQRWVFLKKSAIALALGLLLIGLGLGIMHIRPQSETPDKAVAAIFFLASLLCIPFLFAVVYVAAMHWRDRCRERDATYWLILLLIASTIRFGQFSGAPIVLFAYLLRVLVPDLRELAARAEADEAVGPPAGAPSADAG